MRLRSEPEISTGLINSLTATLGAPWLSTHLAFVGDLIPFCDGTAEPTKRKGVPRVECIIAPNS